jgi:hypothetical protein
MPKTNKVEFGARSSGDTLLVYMRSGELNTLFPELGIHFAGVPGRGSGDIIPNYSFRSVSVPAFENNQGHSPYL